MSDNIVSRYGAVLALRDIDAERQRIAVQAGEFSVLVVGENEAFTSLRGALRAAAKATHTHRTLIYLKGDLFEEQHALEIQGNVFIQPDPDNSKTRPVIRVSGPQVGIKCLSASTQVTIAGVRLELDSLLRKPMHAVQVCTKPLVHAATNGHCSTHGGFVSGAGGAPSRCVEVSMGTVTLQSCLVVNLSGICPVPPIAS